MTEQHLTTLDIVPYWGRMNETIIQLVDCIPDEKLNWSPKPELWNFKGILLHICISRHNWMTVEVGDDGPSPDVLREGQTKDGIKRHLQLSWERLQPFLADQQKLGATYSGEHEGEPYSLTGHWIAYHLLEHDIHHRSDIFHYLALLGIEHPQVGTP